MTRAKEHSANALITVLPVHCERVGRLILARAGLTLGEHKVASTQRTVRDLAVRFADGDPSALLNMLEQNPSHEAWDDFVNAFTINHTAFFREPHHFVKLAEYFREHPAGCSIWCAAASTGEEPYSIAMVGAEVYGENHQNFSILATDIDTKALATAAEGIYTTARTEGVSEMRLKQHFLKGRDKRVGKVRIRPEVQSHVTFNQINLVDPNWPQIGPFDVIFCRNTMIYFDRDAQKKLISRFARVLRPGGLLFIGHSESIAMLSTEFRLLGQTVYQKL